MRDGGGRLADSFPGFVGFAHGRFAGYLSRVPDACAVDDASDGRAVQTVEKALKRVDRAQHLPAVVFGSRYDEPELFVFQFGVTSATAVDERLHLGAHRVEVDGRGHDDNICRDHLFDDFGGIVLLRTGFSVQTACPASGAVADVLVAQEDLFGVVSRIGGSAQKFVAQSVRVAAPAGARREYQYFFRHNTIYLSSETGSGRRRPRGGCTPVPPPGLRLPVSRTKIRTRTRWLVIRITDKTTRNPVCIRMRLSDAVLLGGEAVPTERTPGGRTRRSPVRERTGPAPSATDLGESSASISAFCRTGAFWPYRPTRARSYSRRRVLLRCWDVCSRLVYRPEPRP